MARALALGGRGERGLGNLVRSEPQLGRPAKRLGHDPGQAIRAAADGWPVHHPRPRSVPADHVPGVGETSVDGADGVGVDAQRCAQLTHRRQSSSRLEPPGLDLVRELPVDLGGDRDVGVPRDVELVVPVGPRSQGRGPFGRQLVGPFGGRKGAIPAD